MNTFATRASLLGRLRDLKDDGSWRRFFNIYWKLILATARQAGLSRSEAEDVAQETMLAVARRMPGFKYDPALGSFRGWLLLITKRRIVDHLRRRPDTVPSSGSTSTAEEEREFADPNAEDPGAAWDAQWERTLLAAALQELRRSVDPKQWQIFDCYVLKEWPVAEVTRTLKVTPAQVYLAKHRLTGVLEKIVRRLDQGP